jgi:hypothetical protein
VSVFTLIAGLAMFNTLAMIVMEKTKEIAILRSMGYTRQDISRIFLWQAAIVLGIGSVLGCAMGAVITYAISQYPLPITRHFHDRQVPGANGPVWHYIEAVGCTRSSSSWSRASSRPAGPRGWSRATSSGARRNKMGQRTQNSPSAATSCTATSARARAGCMCSAACPSRPGAARSTRSSALRLRQVAPCSTCSGCSTSRTAARSGSTDQLMSNSGDSIRTAARGEHIGFVFQFHFLMLEFTALENVMMPMRKLGRN